ncbi:hypothetical protein KY347_01045 [Candidatus Woesearchaeota archaeon]|nr:hypothetical protein [Candidatus Woesearchaeota archaeon]
MELKSVSLDLAIEFPEKKVKLIEFSKKLIQKVKGIKELKISKGKEIVLELESDSFKFLVTPLGIMGRLKPQHSLETLFIELERLLNSLTEVITNLVKNASCGIDIQVVYTNDFSSIIQKVISDSEMKVNKKKIRIPSFLIDLNEKENECPYNIKMYNHKAVIQIRFCVGSPKICEKNLCIMPKEVKISEKVQVAKKVIEGLL